VGGVELLAQARAMGLTVTEHDGRLVVRGPVRHEPLACRLLAAKPEVLDVLRVEADWAMFPMPIGPCRHCNGRDYWRREGGHWLCETCHPAPYRDVVAEEGKAGDPPPPWSGLPEEAKEALERYGWEPVRGVVFPADVPASGGSVASVSAAVQASSHSAPMQGVLDVG